ncbi:molybdate transport system permease protein [Propionibacterium cyclohexanicum]|uniref:Molybdenum transport system permease n=1 Tax=Propionibacterium cyclohexanicum TaxID=64702 RepID=A0A1H9TYE6_9ACTN|nr:ABC transporter permease [Propionibacterium cyclohexanicum]SES02275.1 molybdate transport system permease protein [Propionibacterium cyclohexanicum]
MTSVQPRVAEPVVESALDARRSHSPRPFSGLPRWLYVPAFFGAVFIVLPIVAMAIRMDWSRIGEVITSTSSLDALVLSLKTSCAAMIVCVVLGVPMAMVLAREHFWGQEVIRSLVLLPLVLPPVVGGIALLYTFGRHGLLAPVMNLFGLNIAFSTAAVVLSQSFVAMPFLVVSLEGTLRTVGQRYEVVAATLGARPSTVLRTVTLPLVMPGLASAAVLSFARALGEFGATLTFAGSLQGVTRTMPLEINLQNTSGDPDAAIGLSLVLVALAVIVTVVTATISERGQR